jgi:hypothetical protein
MVILKLLTLIQQTQRILLCNQQKCVFLLLIFYWSKSLDYSGVSTISGFPHCPEQHTDTPCFGCGAGCVAGHADPELQIISPFIQPNTSNRHPAFSFCCTSFESDVTPSMFLICFNMVVFFN